MNRQKVKLRVGMAQVNPTVGAIEYNFQMILQCARDAAEAKAQLLVFPEMVLTGYPVEDLALRSSFRSASKQAINKLASEFPFELAGIIGYLEETSSGSPQNAVALIHESKIVARYIKHHLPNYGVFDEFRNFTPGKESLIFRLCGIDIGVAICEDIWHFDGPVQELASRKPGLVLVPNGSPFEREKDDVRAELVAKRARQIESPLVYVNMVGGQDDLVFDGDSVVANAEGRIIQRSKRFTDEVVFLEIDCESFSSNPDLILSEACVAESRIIEPKVEERLSKSEEVWNAIVLGLKDYVKKNGFSSVILGLSGGIDSAVTAAIAVDALGKDRVFGVALPSKYSSDHSLIDAAETARRLGLNYRVIPIQPMVDPFVMNLGLLGVAEENVQARVRGTTLMGLSNQEGHLVLATGNKSELSVGYSTLYGDAVGGYAPIKDVLKSQVWEIAKWRNEKAIDANEIPPIPENSIDKDPSAELRLDQKDADSLPDYKILDAMLEIYVEQDGGLEGLLAAGFSEELAIQTIKLVDVAEYKRRQYPPGPKVSIRAFGKDRRLPITSKWRESI